MKNRKRILIVLSMIVCVVTALCLCACLGGGRSDKCSHEWGKWKTKASANCTVDGLKIRKCSLCGEVEEKVISATGHAESDWIIDKVATCTKVGSTHKECTVCGVTLETEEIGKIEHNYATSVVTNPTCTEQGYTTHICSCGDSYVDSYVDALRQDLVYDGTQDVTYAGSEETVSATEHIGSDWIIDVESTCTKAGSKHKECTVCGVTLETEEIEKIEHNYTTSVVTNPTCTAQGYTTHTCSCGDSYVDSYVDTLGHDLVHHKAQDPTCTAVGWEVYDTCSRCDYTTYKQIEALGHDLVHHEAQDVTCTEAGWQTYDTCSRCSYSTDVEIEATGHTSSDWVVDKKATCTEAGAKHKECTVCGVTLETEEITALGHDLVHHKAQDPTCTAVGWQAYGTCSRCDYTTYKQIEALGHDLVHHEAQDATCTEAGWEVYDTCSRCSYSIYVEIEATGHTSSDWIVDKEATCTEAGAKHKECTVCGVTLETEEIVALGHDLVHHKAQDPTCTAVGWQAYDTCSRCSYSTHKEIKALGHDLVHYEAQDPTYTEAGWKAYDACSRCSYSTYREIKALGYELSVGMLTAEANAMAETGELAYTRDGDVIYFGTYPQSEVTDSELKSALTTEWAGELPPIVVSILRDDEIQVKVSYDDCNPFGMIAGYFGKIDSLYQHIFKTASDSTISGFNSISELFADFMGNFEGVCSELYDTSISGYNGTQVNIRYDDCNPFGMIAGYFGEIEQLSKHTSKTASETIISDFNSLSKSFADFMSNFVVPKDGTKYIPTIGSNASSAYTLFYNKAIGLYNSSLVSFTKNVSNSLTKSAVIGANYPYTMLFGNAVSSDIDYQTLIANLFGFSSKTQFMNYAQNLADTYAKYRTDIANSVPTNGALENGCFYTKDGSFVFPIAVKNELFSPVLTYVIIDTEGLVSVWVNDIESALWATNFNSSYHTASIMNNVLYCKNILFVTGPNFMWYIDVENDGEKYRGVYFTNYRPYGTTESSSMDNSYQCDNKYYKSNVYWFKYEPIKWKILTESDGKAFLLADMAIDSQDYYISGSSHTGNGSTVYANNYEYSTIRAWLNDAFYNTAFNDLQKELIQTTTVDNSALSTGSSSNSYACANTSDKVFLLSYTEATTYLTSNSARIRQSTDYAKSQGIYTSASDDNCWWWLRSPYYDYSGSARGINDFGSAGISSCVNSTNIGIVPALWIVL